MHKASENHSELYRGFVWQVVLLIFGMHAFAFIGLIFPSWEGLALMFVLYLYSGLGVTVGYHRLFTHNSFKTNWFIKRNLAIAGMYSGEGDVLGWVATHKLHHATSDTPDDPHSPLYGGWWYGFWHSHVLWTMLGRNPHLRLAGKELVNDPFMKFLKKTYAYWHFGLIGVLALSGCLYGWFVRSETFLVWQWERVMLSSPWSALYYTASFVGYGYFVRIVWVLNATWSVNSLSHMFGSQPYKEYSKDNSRNNWLVSLLALGEGWHNNHHACQTSYRHGVHWWQFDPSARFIELLWLVGWATDLKPFKPASKEEEG